MLVVRYQLPDNWPIINGSPLAYLVALRNGLNDSSVYPPEQIPRPEGKAEFDAIISRHGGGVPRLIARIERATAYSGTGVTQELRAFLRQLPAGEYFCKPDFGGHGTGAHRLQIAAAGLTVDGRHAGFDELERTLSAEPYLLQESLVPSQHPVQARYSSDVINSIRFMVLTTENGPVIGGAFMRLANGHAAADNFSQGGVAVAIDLARGVLCPSGVVKPRFRATTVHEKSGLPLKGQPVPLLEEASALVRRLHGCLAVKSLGWDVALLKDGPCILESNRTWDVHLAMRIVPGFFARFMRCHLHEPVEATARFDFSGDFPDAKLARHWFSYVLGQSLVSGRLEHLSRTRAVVVASGSRRGIDATAHRFKHEAGAFKVSKIRAAKVDDRIAPGFDVEASFAADEAAAHA
jgi:hypothetical protein